MVHYREILDCFLESFSSKTKWKNIQQLSVKVEVKSHLSTPLLTRFPCMERSCWLTMNVGVGIFWLEACVDELLTEIVLRQRHYLWAWRRLACTLWGSCLGPYLIVLRGRFQMLLQGCLVGGLCCGGIDPRAPACKACTSPLGISLIFSKKRFEVRKRDFQWHVGK